MIFFAFQRDKKKSDIYKKTNKLMLMPWGLRFGRLRSSINVFYFFRILCRNYKILPIKKWENYNFSHEKATATTNIQSLHAFSFFLIIITDRHPNPLFSVCNYIIECRRPLLLLWKTMNQTIRDVQWCFYSR